VTRSLKKNPFVANHLLRKIEKLNTKEEKEIIVKNGPFIDGRTTGIEPAHGGFTIHCLDPLGYIRPYPRTGLSLYLRSDPF
jgi:ribosomal protein S19